MVTNRRNFLKCSTNAALLAVIAPAPWTLISSKQKSKKMAENTITVLAIAETSPDKINELKSICTGLIEPTRKEEGCISYELYQDTNNPGIFTFIERWKSQEHLDIHLKTPHLVAAGEAFSSILSKDLVILMLNQIA